MNSTVDVVVVGGGPAGLSGALELARAGASVTLLDENVELGGQYYQRRRGEVLRRLGDHRPEGTRLIGEVRAAGVDVRTQNLAWGREGMTLHILDRPSGESTTVECRAILLATGAYERSLPFPGWTLPGVCTPGLALHLSQTHGVAVGRRVVVAGTGPFLLVVATALLEVGAAVEAVVELNRPYRPQLQALGALRDFARLRELAGYFAALRRHRVRIVQGRRLVAATGKDRVEVESMQAPISVGDIQVRPGDILVGDADGVLLIPRVRESEVFDTAREIEQAEQAIERETAKGIRLDEARKTFRYHQLQTHA